MLKNATQHWLYHGFLVPLH
uniref:Uncharacterized protein n=1 Tax=Anguilla anguilla TaxID=7936 RepID=A0A0E9S3R1_ANGAN